MRQIKTAFAVVLVGLVTACSTSEPELPPPPPGSVVTSVSASSRDRDINGLPARPTSTNLDDNVSVTGEAGTTADECRNINNAGSSIPQTGNSNLPVDGSAPEDCVRGSVTLGG